MGLTARCGGCKKVYKVGENLAGKKVKCKQCGEVFVVPKVVTGVLLGAEPAVKKAAPPVRAAAKRPAAEASDDPFAALDALASLEQGTVDHAPPAPPARMTAPAYAPAPPRRKGPVVEYVNETGQTVPRPIAYAPARPVSGWISIPGEQFWDGYLPLIAILAFFVGTIYDLVQKSRVYTSLGYSTAEVWLGGLIAMIILFAVVIPMGALAAMVTTKIFKFEIPGSLYFRSCSAVALVFGINALLGRSGGTLFVARVAGLGGGAVMVLVMLLAVWLAALWVSFRLRPGPFATLAAFCFLFQVFGSIIATFVLAFILGLILNAMRSDSAPKPGRSRARSPFSLVIPQRVVETGHARTEA